MATHEPPNPDAIILSQPKDIIYNIFFRLPVKTLLRLKSVCKSWLSLISSHEFIKTHLSMSTNDPYFTHHHLVIVDWKKPQDLWTCSVYSLLHESSTKALRCKDHLRRKSVVGYCNGLILVKGRIFYCDQLCLWNPSTKEVRTLPELNCISCYPNTVHGFCYDESNDDFKVFAISPAHVYDSNDEIDDSTYYEYKVSVYSLRCDCWRIIGDFPFRLVAGELCHPDFYDGVFANGSIHWLISPERQKNIILSLDIKSETYAEVLQPNYGDGEYYLYLFTSGKSLSVLCEYENIQADLWIAKQCGVEVSWTKLFTIPYMDELIAHSFLVQPICISMNGDVLFISDSTVVLYNPKEKNIKHLLADHRFEVPGVYAYVESLISPNL